MNLVKHTRKPEKQKDGDCLVVVDDNVVAVEIKECHASAEKSGTLNQIRPIKYIPCVVYAPERGCWYVVPAHELVKLAAKKSRGQHNEIPFECCNLSLNSLEEFRCTDDELDGRVRQAIRSSQDAVVLRDAMVELKKELAQINARFKRVVP